MTVIFVVGWQYRHDRPGTTTNYYSYNNTLLEWVVTKELKLRAPLTRVLLVFVFLVTTINSLLTLTSGKFGMNPVVLHVASQSWEVLLENE